VAFFVHGYTIWSVVIFLWELLLGFQDAGAVSFSGGSSMFATDGESVKQSTLVPAPSMLIWVTLKSRIL